MHLTPPRQLLAKLLFIAIFAMPGAATVSVADDVGGSAPSLDIEEAMSTARAYIDQGELKKATKTLGKVVKQDKSNADAWNLLGFSWRKLDKTRKSKKAYARALKLDPDHKGALEYQGELFIKIGDLDKAKDNLVRLETLCPTGCDELENLTKALAGKSSY